MPNLTMSLSAFLKIKTNAGKVKFVTDQLEKQNVLPVAHIKPDQTKNNEKSRQIRKEANAIFHASNYILALLEYNKSICMAENGTEDLGIAFANRSAVYIQIGKPELCLKDIRNAKQNRYPKHLMEKLLARELECMIKKMTPTFDPENLFDPHLRNMKPFVKPNLGRQENTTFGRHIVTTQLINPGDIVIVEDSFVCMPKLNIRASRCWHCMSEKVMYLIPCTHCSHVMFCSEECSKAAHLQYHFMECPIIDNLLAFFKGIDILALRAIFKAIFAFGSLAKIEKFLNEHGKTKVDAFSTVVDGLYENTDQQKFHQVCLYSINVILTAALFHIYFVLALQFNHSSRRNAFQL